MAVDWKGVMILHQMQCYQGDTTAVLFSSLPLS
uniref:Uncharacterized protein n=1 Tax=Rhizophora mucronata TaxID=61149 RepID=A0A2P2NUM9_RHIMU